MRLTALYHVPPGQANDPHVALALAKLHGSADRLITFGTRPAKGPPGCHIETAGNFEAACAKALAAAPHEGLILLTGAHAIGPFTDPRALADIAHTRAPGGLLSAYLRRPRDGAPVPSLDFAIFDAALGARPGFSGIWRARAGQSGPEKARPCERRLAEWLSKGSHPWVVISEVDPWCNPNAAMHAGAPCLPTGLLTLEPLIHDSAAIDLAPALAHLRQQHPNWANVIDRLAAQKMTPRDWAVVSGGYEIMPTDGHIIAPKTVGTIAVFLHVYHPESLPELWHLITHIQSRRDLFITTADETAAKAIAAFLADRGEHNAMIRIPAQNRGRDMSALFITFADIALSGRYDIALRLHSKRSAHLAPQLADSFKRHLFDNLAASPPYVSTILQRFADDPRLGLVMPPAVQIGFGTLGHGWYNNRPRYDRAVCALGIDIPRDTHTPLAPYGTMFWFRPAALQKLFAHPWRFTDYNAEPDHIDGGLAHVQERLIGPAVRDAGYSNLQVMTPTTAARNYAHLEYKYQRLAGQLSSASVTEQARQLEVMTARRPLRRALHERLERAYGRLIRRLPGTQPLLSPLARKVSLLLSR